MAKSDTTDEIVKNRIAELIRNPTATDKGLEKILRENARERIAHKLIWLVGILYISFLISGSFLVYSLKIQFRDLLDLILVLGALSGFLGTAIHFYFKD